MCGIAGTYLFNNNEGIDTDGLHNALFALQRRGPDSSGTYISDKVCLGHTRLSIIDTSELANQPFTDPSLRFTLVYNGMIYNYRQLRNQLEKKQIRFQSESDTEVLMHWLIEHGPDGINQLQGFFSFALFDKVEDKILLARDRFGIKPMYYYFNENRFIFASELKAMLALKIPRIIDMVSLSAYLHLNYIPGPWSIFEQVNKLLPGHYMLVTKKGIELHEYYRIETNPENNSFIPDYEAAKNILKEKLAASVHKRMVAEVPLGAFLSGGIDSSIITALAAREIKHLNTFSIGFSDEPMFDETHHARAVAKMHNTNHTEFRLTTHDLLNCLMAVLDYTDEPFADSSALAVYILSRETRKKVTVALSGDGADELFAGYNKHLAEWKMRNPSLESELLKHLQPLLSRLPQSRNNYLFNKIRQFNRFGLGMKLNATQRYWRWAGFSNHGEIDLMIKNNSLSHQLEARKQHWLKPLSDSETMNAVLLTDMQLVLPYDMLTKVDLMSMANSLEVRVPFLDHEVVNYVFTLPDHYKIDGKQRKKILRDTFRADLPPELYTRKKQGFEVPLLRWFRRDLQGLIENEWLSESFITQQNLFNYQAIKTLKNRLHSKNPGDSPARIWGLIVFQHWWKKHMM